MFEWNDKFNTGITLVDEQHQELFRIAQRIHNLLTDDYSFDKYDKVIILITELKDYTVYHFKTEENYMHHIKYKQFFSHKVEHDDFIQKLNGIDFDKIDENQDKFIKDMLAFVAEWIVKHIMERDKSISAG